MNVRTSIHAWKKQDDRLNYRGAQASRIDNLTDAVFGIAITLLIFNLANPNSFSDLMDFAKTLPAFLLSISFLVLIWYEHFRFSTVFSFNDPGLVALNTFFLALIIFFVYPLRFLALLLTNFLFETNIGIQITIGQMPYLMIFYGLAIFAVYFILFLFYVRAMGRKQFLELNEYELFYTRRHRTKMMMMFIVPLISVGITAGLMSFSVGLASFLGGMTYWLYWPVTMIWEIRFQKDSKAFKAQGS